MQGCFLIAKIRIRFSALRPPFLTKDFPKHFSLSLDTSPYDSSRSYGRTNCLLGRAIAQEVSRWLPTVAAQVRARQVRVGFMVDKVTLGQVSSEYFGFSAIHYSTKSSILIITRDRYSRPNGSRRADWTQLDTPPALLKLKKYRGRTEMQTTILYYSN
jgi:hypothetical protein